MTDTDRWRGNMPQKVVPKIHFPDLRATADWYVSIGFTLSRWNEEDSELNWALLTLGGSEVMLNSGGKSSTAGRREVDLYVHTGEIEQLWHRLSGRVEVVEDLHDTFYGMREFIIRDCNRFWIA